MTEKYYLIKADVEKVENPCNSDCEFFKVDCTAICEPRSRYDQQQALLSHAKLVDLDEAVGMWIYKYLSVKTGMLDWKDEVVGFSQFILPQEEK